MTAPDPARASWPRTLAACSALAFVALAFRATIGSIDVPVGRVEGAVYASELRIPIVGVKVWAHPGEGVDSPARYCTTDRDGRFAFPALHAGAYTFSASTRSHEVSDVRVSIDEGSTQQVVLALSRSEPEITIAEHPPVYQTTEAVKVRVRGYLDPSDRGAGGRLRLSLRRTRLSDVLAAPAGRRDLDRLQSSYGRLSVIPAGLASSSLPVRDLGATITTADHEAYYDQSVALGPLEPGLYLVTIGHGQHRVSDAFQVSDLALVRKDCRGEYLLYTTDLGTGRPVAGATVRILRNTKLVATATSGSDGLARIHVDTISRDYANQAALVAIAARGDHEAAAGRTEAVAENSGEFFLATYTDRPIYRPGHRIQFKGIVRKATEPGYSYAVPETRRIDVELHDSAGNRVDRRICMTNSSGSFVGSIDLSQEAPTGVYTLVAASGQDQQSRDIVVAAYRKPEFSVAAEPLRRRYLTGEMVQFRVSARYYFDAPVAGASMRYYAFREPAATTWSSDEEDALDPYTPAHARLYGETVADGEMRLDQNGEAVLAFPVSAAGPPPDYPVQITLSAYVTDPTGREGEAESAVLCAPSDIRIQAEPAGRLAYPSRSLDIMLRVTDHDGVPSPDRSLEVVAEYERGDESKVAYTRCAAQSARSGSNGEASISLVPPHAGVLRVTVSGRDAQGRRASAECYIWCVDDRGGDLGSGYVDLSIMSDRRSYAPGETARVVLNCPKIGQSALVTVEGNRVYESRVVPVTARSTVIHIPVRQEYGPNVFVSACYVRDKRLHQSEIPLKVSMPQRTLAVSVTPDRTRVSPGDSVTYTVLTKDANGTPCPAEVSVGVVDEAIYALREDDPKYLYRTFYPSRYNAVSTTYSFATAYMGDADKAEPKMTARRRFLDTAAWFPQLATDATGRASVTVRLPDNLTTWRATVVGHSPGTQVGAATSSVVCDRDLLVRIERPRYLVEGDTVQIRVAAHNKTRAALRVMLRASGRGLTGFPTSPMALDIPSGGSTVVPVQIAAPAAGAAAITAAVWSAVPRTPPLADSVESEVTVLPLARDVVDGMSGEVPPVGDSTHEFLSGAGCVAGSEDLQVRLEPSLLQCMSPAIRHLLDYDYGCVEQSTSKLMAALAADELLSATGRPTPVAGLPDRSRLRTLVRDCVVRLQAMRTSSGGWGWWYTPPEDCQMTAYALHGLLRARDAGHAVSALVIAEAARRLSAIALGARGANKAYAVYVLALAGNRDAALKVRTRTMLGAVGIEGIAYLALADHVLGYAPSTARPLDVLRRMAHVGTGTASWSPSNADRWTASWSDTMATAAAALALARVAPGDPLVPQAIRQLLISRVGEGWASTRDTAWALEAIRAYLQSRGEPSMATGIAIIVLNGHEYRRCAIGSTASPADTIVPVPPSALRNGRNVVEIRRAGGAGTLRYSVRRHRLVRSGQPIGPAPPGLTIKRRYYSVRPQITPRGAWVLDEAPIDGPIASGAQVRVRLDITVPRNMAYAMVQDRFPAGLEISDRGEADADEVRSSWFEATDVRDDRITWFARQIAAGAYIVRYHLRAQTPSRSTQIEPSVQSMYAPDIRAEGKPMLVEVRP